MVQITGISRVPFPEQLRPMQPQEVIDPIYREASVKTATHLRTIAYSAMAQDLSRLSLPEIDQIVSLVAQIIPAGNVPGMILNGLARLPEHKPPHNIIKRDVNLLFRAVNDVLNKTVYNAFFAGPATVIWGYQNLLKLAGKDPEGAFPEGTWQFYVDYALREDTARHANETQGFDTVIRQFQIQLGRVDRITAWLMASIHCLHQYPALLANEWRERIFTRTLTEVTAQETNARQYASIYRNWEKQRPYARSQDSGSLTYSEYRRICFDRFLNEATNHLPAPLQQRWQERIHLEQEKALPAYLRQMNILAYLDPGPYGETREHFPITQACIGLISGGPYYLLPVCEPGTNQPASFNTIRSQVAAILAEPGTTPSTALVRLAQIRRMSLADFKGHCNPQLRSALTALRYAPILLNIDPTPDLGKTGNLPVLSELRQAERGIGDHPLTIFDAGRTFVFDQSHIFFDGTWGAALAEILTQEALSWAVYLKDLPAPRPSSTHPGAMHFPFTPLEQKTIQQAPGVSAEVGAENSSANLKAILSLRKLFKRRSDLLELTVNDLLILYRAIHALTYQPSPNLIQALQNLSANQPTRAAALAALEAIDSSKATNPAILIPVDASQRSPRDRLYPLAIEVPLQELNLLELHTQTLQSLGAYRQATGDREKRYANFDQLQRRYLATLAGFGEVMSKAKQIAIIGESASVGTIKLLAHLPPPLQRMLEAVPGHFDLLNDIIKGREVFSNVGAVAPSSTLTRFITAKDDNEKKTLAWGILTDAQGIMHISLRDFRPHVRHLEDAGQRPLAACMAQEYLDSYVLGLNRFIKELQQITASSRETKSTAHRINP